VAVRAPTLGALAVVLAAIGMAGCGSEKPKVLDTERIERAIQASILQKRNLQAQVSCPSGIKQEKGVVFRCIATYKGGRTPFVVTQDDSKGSVHYVGVRK
jgi:hypothetical protein